MKQLLSLSKDRKEEKKPNIKQLALNYHLQEDQQQNFIYQQQNDKNDGPSDHEIRTYAEILGIKLPEEEDLLYLARQCLNQPMPPHWRCEQDQRGQIIYVNDKTGQVSFDHPCDEIFKQKVIAQRKKKIKDLKKSLPKINIQKSKTSFVQNVFKAKQQTSQPDSKSNRQKTQNKQQNMKPLKNLQIITNEDLISPNKPFLYDDDDQPVHPIRQKKTEVNKNQTKPTKHKHQPKKQAPAYLIKLNTHQKQSNPAQFQQKKHKIQQKLQKKYCSLTQQLQNSYINSIKQMKHQQQCLKNKSLQQIKQQIGQSKLQRKRKQIQMKLMLQHTQEVQALRLQYQRQYRNCVVDLGMKYQIQGLFSQLARCRKFFSEGDEIKNQFGCFQEMGVNLGVVNRLEIEKVCADLEGKGSKLMHSLLVCEGRPGITNLSFQKQSELINLFDEKLSEMVEKVKISHEIGKQKLELFEQKDDIPTQINQQKQILQQLQNLKRKLKQLQQQNNTQRSNLSDKQNKLYELLQNKVGSSSSRLQRR